MNTQTRTHQHRLTREMVEDLIEDFALDMLPHMDDPKVRQRLDGKALLMILDNATRDAGVGAPGQHVTGNVRDLISADEALAVFEAAMARVREAKKRC